MLPDIPKQLELCKETLKIQLEYDLITEADAEHTLSQYNDLFFYGCVAFKKDDIYRFFNKDNSQKVIKKTKKEIEKAQSLDSFVDDALAFNRTVQEEERKRDPTYTISRRDIRNITGYTYNPIPAFDGTNNPVHIKWQKDVLESTEDRLVVDGSRQMGKSLIMAQLLTEESYEQGDILVAAPQQSTTDVIKDYMLFHTRDFPEGTFVYKERKKYIENTMSGTRIHFRTLEDGGKNIRGLTIRLVVIDEAQLASRTIIEEVVEPTTTTTGGRMLFIGTAVEDLTSYMYYIIESVDKESNDFNTADTFSARVIRVSADENPMIHPKNRSAINAKKHLPTTQREYYNKWGKLEDALFNPRVVPSATIQNYIPIDRLQDAIPVFGIDPARTSDRSAYSLQLVYKDKVVTYESGFVPSQYKNNWMEQAKFYVSLQKKYSEIFNGKLYIVFDKTGVGDAVAPIFKQHGLNITHLIQYTAGTSVSSGYDKGTNDYVISLGKSLLINNYLNYCSSPSYAILKDSNSALNAEIRHIQLTETSR